MNKNGSFGRFPKDKLLEAAAKGGRNAHAKGTAHEWTSDAAVIAGSKGGLVSQARRRAAREATRKRVDNPAETC